MAISDTQRKDFLKQLADAKKQLEALQSQIKPKGQVLGASTSGLNAAQQGGASGVGFEDEGTQQKIAGQVGATLQAGGSKSQAGDGISRAQAQGLAKSFGLEGIVDTSKYAGLSYGAAAEKAKKEKEKRTGQITSNVSFAYNPETIAGTKKIVDRVGIGLNDITSNSWESKGTQQDKIKATLDASAKQIASLFNSQEEYNNAVATNPQLQQSIQQFETLGGNAQDIAGKIATPVATTGEQTTGDYLSNLSNPQANQEAEQAAINELIPEKAIIQQEIARQQRIPEEMISLYFGTEDQIGIIELKKNQAIEEKRIIEEREKDDKISVRAKADLTIQKNNADLKVQTAQIEENRLAAKNYMTGMLAKLGALKTTGAAPVAIQTLDTKYEIATQTLTNKYQYEEQRINNALTDALNGIENDTDDLVLKLEQDLTKDFEDITKEVMKLQQKADRETYALTIKYASKLRERTVTHTKELKAEAEKYAKAFAKAAGGGIDLFSLAGTVGGALGRASDKTAITAKTVDVKTDIKKNLPSQLSSKILTELTDEQARVFLEDYLNERVDKQQSFNPVDYYENWKKELDIKQPKEEKTSLEKKLEALREG